MADLETTKSKLRSTPTAGVSGEHSAYYRRLLSSGYKGYIQGSIGGGALYGTIGLGIGAVVGAALAPFTAGQSLWLIPVLGGSFSIYGAHTFADIGKTAAIIADSADLNEKRRTLLDRYYETPNDEEALEIKRQLEQEHARQDPEQKFHWRPALIGAAIGIVLAITAVALMSSGIPALHFMEPALHLIMSSVGLEVVGGTLAAGHVGLAASIGIPGALATLGAAGAAIGGMAGSLIGIDREYIRRWLDKAEFTVHEPSRAESELAMRERDIERLTEAARRGEVQASREQRETVTSGKIHVTDTPNPIAPSLERSARPAPISPEVIANGKPSPQVSDAAYADRVVNQTQQMAPNV